MMEWQCLFKELNFKDNLKEDDLETFNKLSTSWTSKRQQTLFIKYMSDNSVTTWDDFSEYLDKHKPDEFFPFVNNGIIDLKSLAFHLDVTQDQLIVLFGKDPNVGSFKKLMDKLLKTYIKDITSN